MVQNVSNRSVEQNQQAIKETVDHNKNAEELRKKAEEAAAREATQGKEVHKIQDPPAATTKDVDKIEAKKDTHLTGYKEVMNAPTVEENKRAEEQRKENGGLSVRDLLKQHEEKTDKKVKV